ncbi:MAG TPA: alpha/beta hydrolase [Polaromonas sp.]|uniref:alpha/beta fold hydrolase n=1 Tax=Polaromonas sp. TaxID=1869339 RepID=UPI002D73B6A5|nr:alpha/beta hydrolase [Polaromonas sp.]HYW56595.1 alpha/beta hydrolase [Polaromonas sp.]
MSWVLLRGLTREARHWSDLPERLAPALNGAPVIALDLPGNGKFYGLPSPSSVGSMVDFARKQLLTQGCKPPYSFMAMSLGGMVATHWAQHYPDEVAGLVLINTSMRPFNSLTERLRPGNWPQLALLAARWEDVDHCERVIHQLTCNRATTRDEDLAAWRRIRKSAPVSAANARRQLWAAARFSSAAQAPRCAVMVLSSAADDLVHPLCSTRLAAAWQARHHQHPWAGHDLPHDDADWVCQRTADWLTLR